MKQIKAKAKEKEVDQPEAAPIGGWIHGGRIH